MKDEPILEYIVSLADIKPSDVILEIGPGQGNLTKHLLKKASKVIAVEKDEALAVHLSRVRPWKGKLEVVSGDILHYDLSILPYGYKVVANIPYYLTGKLLKILCESPNSPAKMVLLVQKEVAQRICAKPGHMSILSVSVQLYYDTKAGQVVPAKLFSPPPKVDSQILILKARQKLLFPRTVLGNKEAGEFLRIVKAGFSVRRKKLRNSLSGGLQISKQQTDQMLARGGINGELRAQDLNLKQWYKLYKARQTGSDAML